MMMFFCLGGRLIVVGYGEPSHAQLLLSID